MESGGPAGRVTMCSKRRARRPYLRRKIEADPKNPDLIKTVRGRGYVFASNVEVR